MPSHPKTVCKDRNIGIPQYLHFRNSSRRTIKKRESNRIRTQLICNSSHGNLSFRILPLPKLNSVGTSYYLSNVCCCPAILNVNAVGHIDPMATHTWHTIQGIAKLADIHHSTRYQYRQKSLYHTHLRCKCTRNSTKTCKSCTCSCRLGKQSAARLRRRARQVQSSSWSPLRVCWEKCWEEYSNGWKC